ncbi:MAG: sulfatase-like hydrolase/transferase [Haloarculaceae archaeon]
MSADGSEATADDGDRSRERPNVLVVFTDQQRWDTVGAYDSPLDLTPNLDAAAERGTVYEQAVSSQPVCAPTRACLQTGQYATTHGVWRNGLVPDDTDTTLAEAFAGAGYDTGYVGKWHLGGTGTDPVPEERRLGYDDYWRAADALEHTSHPYEGLVYDGDGDRVAFDGYRVDALTDMTVDFLRRDRENPFFCVLSHLEPHHQNDMATYAAPAGYEWRHRDPWVPPDLRARSGQGDWYSELPDYYGICERIDETYGRLLDVLADEGELSNTVVVFVSDHGSHFRTRNAEYKRSVHDSSVRVPLVVRGPGFEGGNRVAEPVSLVDVPPTLLDAAGVTVPTSMEGNSTLPLVRGDSERGEVSDPDWDGEVFVQVSESEVGRAIRTARWTYEVVAPGADGWETPASDRYVERYLYDRHADPYQLTNLAGRPEYRDVADGLRERLTERVREVEGADPAVDTADSFR